MAGSNSGLRQVTQRCDERCVGGQQLFGVEIGGVDPAELLAFEALGFALPPRNQEELELNGVIGVVMTQIHERPACGHIDTEFFR